MRRETLLLEIGTEEIPARFMAPALKQLEENAKAALLESRLEHGEVFACGTPRRIALLIGGLAEKQADLSEKKRGPAAKAAYDAAGSPTKAAMGFARGQGVAVEELFTEEVDGVAYVFAKRNEPGRETVAILPDLCERLIRAITFPKPMFWYSKEIRFARPIRWLCALYGNRVVPLTFAGLTSDKNTVGHRFLSKGPIEITDPARYMEIMEKEFVIADPAKRRQIIAEQVRQAATALGGRSVIDEDLLDEVVNLVEWPKAVVGNFSPDYLEIPQEVLITAMRAHQRYFPVFDEQDVLLPHFITISNGTIDEFAANVRTGNERVLRARLADARFFFEEDRKKPLSVFVDMLDSIVFMESLGTMRKKTERLVSLSSALAEQASLGQEDKVAAVRGAFLAKADLMTHMVHEFPELQGIMGMHYARLSGETVQTASAVAEHYKPRFAGDRPAASLPGAVVSIADKMDTLAACFGLGLIPTGSQDPYALRRSALGVVATMLAHNITVSPGQLARLALNELREEIKRDTDEAVAEMTEFILQRLRFQFAELGLRYDVIDAAVGATANDLPGLLARARLLQDKLETPELTRILTPFTRVANLTRGFTGTALNEHALSDPAEVELYKAVVVAKEHAAQAKEGDFAAVFAALAPLYGPIDRFFTEVMVMVDNEEQKNNRLALLAEIKDLFFTLGDLSKIVQEKK
jgi:glycyl-tRNA synthetase beta chain